MAGLDPAIHVYRTRGPAWMPGSSPGMATEDCGAICLHIVIARSPCDEAIHNTSAERFWIASLRSQ